MGCSGSGRTDDGASGKDCCDGDGSGADFCALNGRRTDIKKSGRMKRLMVLWRMNTHSSSIDAIEHLLLVPLCSIDDVSITVARPAK